MKIELEDFENTTSLYIEGLQKDKNMRYRSFDHCYFYFKDNYEKYGDDAIKDTMALHLFAYLSSWGMLRNSFLLQKDYQFNREVVEIIAKKMYETANNNNNKNLSAEDLIELRDAIRGYYIGKKFYKPVQSGFVMKERAIKNVTDVLISKNLLGTTGLVPAFDRYVKRAMKEISIDGSFNEGSVHLLNIFVEENDEAIKKVQKTIKNDLGVEYPPMKVVDMYLWQRGFELVCKEKQKKKVVKDNLSK